MARLSSDLLERSWPCLLSGDVNSHRHIGVTDFLGRSILSKACFFVGAYLDFFHTIILSQTYIKVSNREQRIPCAHHITLVSTRRVNLYRMSQPKQTLALLTKPSISSELYHLLLF